MKKKNNRGISLAETIIAMTVILVVSATASGLITRYLSASSKMMNRYDAVSMSESVIECFDFSETYNEFNRAIIMIPDNSIERKGYSDNKIVVNEEEIIKTQYAVYDCSTSGYTMTITVTYNYENGVATLSIHVEDADKTEIYALYGYSRSVSGL